MYKANTKHLQPLLISNINELPEKHKALLEKSWASTFYTELFCRIKEDAFKVLYADMPSRPNEPINRMIGFETLKVGFGWTDEETYSHYVFDLQVRYALGLQDLHEGDFDLRTLYNFRARLSRYNSEHGVNLMDKAFEDITDQQITTLKIKTGKQRMDSTQIASNIREMSRLQLLVEVLQRVYRMLAEEDQQKYSEQFADYLQGHAGQYVYRIKGQDTGGHIDKIGKLMQRLLEELKPNYEQEPVYQVLKRVFAEHYRIEEKEVKTKEGKELSASSLQSPDDLEATYREKGRKSYKGYVANLTETCDPENELQLITKVQVASNTTEDADLLVEALPNLKQRMGLDTLYDDGGFGSPAADQALQENSVVQIQTAIRGRTPSTEKLNLSDFEIKQTEKGVPARITCPQEQTVEVHPSSQKKGYVAHFDDNICQACPFFQSGACPAQKGKRDARMHLRFTQQEANVSQRRRQNRVHQEEGYNRRAAIEGTVHQVKHHFPGGKVPVRGKFRVACTVIAAAMMSNVRRIHRYLDVKMEPENEVPAPIITSECSQEQSQGAFFLRLLGFFNGLFRPNYVRLHNFCF